MNHGHGIQKFSVLKNGAKLPTVGLGTFVDKQYVSHGSNGKVASAVRTAISLGYRHIDTAWTYNTEEEVGCGINDKIQDGTVTREDLFIVTKLWRNFLRHDQVKEAFQRSLQELNLTYVDLYLIHCNTGLQMNGNPSQHYPNADDYRPYFNDVDYIETWKELEKLVDEGLVKAIGVSNFNIRQLERVIAVARHPLSVVQVELHPYLSQPVIRDFCRKNNILVTAYCPLACGDKPFFKSPKPLLFTENPIIQTIALKHQKSAFQIVLRYELQLGVVVIPKSTNPKHIAENFQIFDFQLRKEEMEAIASLNINYRLLDQHKFKEHKNFPFSDDEGV